MRPAPGWAAWGDTTNVTGTTVAAMSVPGPSAIGCTVGGLAMSVVVATTPVADARVEYVARVFTAAVGGSQVGADKVMTGTGSVREAVITGDDLPGALAVGTTYYVRVHARLAASPSWEAAAHRTHSFTIVKSPVTTLFSCGAEEPPGP
jgi:hypothetical protein